MNILLTSVGRRAYMVKYFKEVLGENGLVHVCNSDEKSVAFKYADKKVISPLIYDKTYIPFLLEYCKRNNINIIISLFDIDLLVLAKHKKDFETIGTRVIVSDYDVVSICNDKWLTYKFLKEHDFNTPKSFLNLNEALDAISNKILSYPIIVKPRFGCGSISVEIANDEEDLKYLTKKVNTAIKNSYLKYESSVTEDVVIYQECLKGQEYGADIINDLNGITKNAILRKKIAMRSGETDIAEIVDDPDVKDTLLKLGNAIKHVANLDCDIFIIDGKAYILEMNARFGGGYPFSHMGGCNLPNAIINWVEGKNVPISMISSQSGIIGYKEIYITKM